LLKLKEISVSRTFNLGNFENVKPEISAAIGEDDDPQEGLKILDEELKDFRKNLEK
jgi:hypothetical protein